MDFITLTAAAKDFKTDGFMIILGLGIVAFVIIQSVFFIARAWKRAKELGIKPEVLKNTVTSSALFTIAPAIAILVTVFALQKALGYVLPWIRLSVIGNIAYESTAASSVLGGDLSQAVTDPAQFGAIAFVMTIGSSLPLFLLPVFCKKIHKKVGGAMNNGESKIGKLADYISAAAFIGIVTAFVAQSIMGKGSNASQDAGFLSVATLICAIIITLVLELICKKFKLTKFEPFVMPLAMFGAMACAVLITNVVPENVVTFTWPWLQEIRAEEAAKAAANALISLK